jgi:hypothetical protein
MTLASTLRRNFPTLRYVVAPFRWFFGSRRRVLSAAAVLLAMIAAPPLWWAVQLLGLPDIGTPFDVRGFRSFAIPDGRNAFVLYRKAARLLKPIESSNGPVPRFDSRRPDADQALHQWLDENREAMEIYRLGSDQPDAFDSAAFDDHESQRLRSALMSFYFLALLEASRREEQENMAGAWNWYRAALRATYHQGRYASVGVRLSLQNWHGMLRGRLSTWAADSRTTAGVLRRALDDLIACEGILPSDAYTIMWEYPALETMLEGPANPGQSEPYTRLGTIVKSWEIRPTPEQIYAIGKAWRSWRREPERSRRVLRLAVANWLAYYELPLSRRPKPDPHVFGPLPFYAFGPEAPANARAVSPAELGRWLASTIDADGLLRSGAFLWNFRSVKLQDQAHYRALVTLVASELYRRERGEDPPSDEALVGPYLKSLPDDGPADAPGTPRSAGQEPRR